VWGGAEVQGKGTGKKKGSKKATSFLLWEMGIQRTAEEGFARC